MAKKPRVLHVEDERDTLEVVKTILEKEGYEVTEARSGEEALKKIEGGNFDLLLLDIMMPDMSGWDLFTRISKLEKTYAVVFLTVLEATKERLKIIKEYGVADYITKPFDRDDFVKRIAGALKK